MNINNCTDALDLVYFLSEGCEGCDSEYDDCGEYDDSEEYDEEYVEDDTEVDDDVYDAAMEDLYGDGISIGDLDAEEMSCSIGQLVEDEIEDIIYDDMVDEGYSGEDDDEDDEEDDDDDEDLECALENDMFYFV